MRGRDRNICFQEGYAGVPTRVFERAVLWFRLWARTSLLVLLFPSGDNNNDDDGGGDRSRQSVVLFQW